VRAVAEKVMASLRLALRTRRVLSDLCGSKLLTAEFAETNARRAQRKTLPLNRTKLNFQTFINFYSPLTRQRTSECVIIEMRCCHDHPEFPSRHFQSASDSR
jgi:hypothetical protein